MADKGTRLTASNSPMNPGDSLHSPGFAYTLTMQALSGDLVASSGNWDSGTGGHPNAYCSMLLSGDLVVYDQFRNPLKHSQTGGHTLSLGIDDNGDVHLYNPDGTIYKTNFQMYPFSAAAHAPL